MDNDRALTSPITVTPTITESDIADDPASLTEIFGRFLRLYVAEGDAPLKGIFVSPATMRTYHAQASQFVAWCRQHGLSPAAATETDIIAYRKHLVEAGYKPTTIGLKLAVVRRLFEAIRWRGLRHDNPAAGVKAPKDRTSRDERVKYLPLEGLRQLLAAPQGDGPLARRNRAILALMGLHGLRVAEVAGLQTDDIDLGTGEVKVLGKGRKIRTVHLIDHTVELLAAWLDVRQTLAMDGVSALFVVAGPNGTGTALGARGIRYVVDRHLTELGLKAEGISCHALRHSSATWARAGGARLDAIAGMLGHASVTTTSIYARIVDRIAENPARYLEELIGLS
ncbi:MAG: tyrosine-type recombinase/integrase [Anaerolineae bacterium]